MSAQPSIFDPALWREMVEGRYVRVAEHPELPMSVASYTEHAQYDRVWNDVTTHTRGIVWNHETGEVVAKPFAKFHNWSEHGPDDHPLTWGEFVVSEKLDGSLGVLYPCGDGSWAVATRGSFTSEQARWATNWWRANARENPVTAYVDGFTWCFEIIYPANRIVVNYGDREGLVFLAAVDRRGFVGGRMHEPSDRIERARTWDALPTEPHLLAEAVGVADDGNFEGFVCYFPASGRRCKVKLDTYVRLHRLITQTSARTVWEHLSAGGVLADLVEGTPDEFHEWVRVTVADLEMAHRSITNTARLTFNTIGVQPDRKTFAEKAKASIWPTLMFALLDGKDIAPMVWRMLKPEAERAHFAQPTEAA